MTVQQGVKQRLGTIRRGKKTKKQEQEKQQNDTQSYEKCGKYRFAAANTIE